jgi:hypothetical protein
MSAVLASAGAVDATSEKDVDTDVDRGSDEISTVDLED